MASVLSVTSVPVPAMPSDWRYGATVVSKRAMLVSFSTQLSAADISVRENSRVTKGPVRRGSALRAGAALALRRLRRAARATVPAVGTSATAAATVTALSRPARLLPAVHACPLRPAHKWRRPRSMFQVAHLAGQLPRCRARTASTP